MNEGSRTQGRRLTLEENKQVGDFTENAVCAYFEASGFSMSRFGVEHIFPDWAGVIADDAYADRKLRGTPDIFEQQQDLTKFLRSFPDFMAIRTAPSGTGTREIFPVEVKFRTEQVFPRLGRQSHFIRLSNDSVAGYRKHWPSTLLVVVCYRARTMIATRIDKLTDVPDSRVPIKASDYRKSWLYNSARNGFRPLWDFEQGYFDFDLGAETVGDVIAFADLAAQRDDLALE